MREVNVIEDAFCDHAPSYATFQLPCALQHHWHWPRPVSLPWEQLQATSEIKWDFDAEAYHRNPQAAFASWSSHCEKSVADDMKRADLQLPRGHLGRGQTLHPFKRPNILQPLRHGRDGDELPKSDLGNRSLHLWFKQLRRLQAYVQRLPRIGSPQVQADQLHTWCKIRAAAGFHGGFIHWWQSRAVQLHGSPFCIPWLPPDAETAKRIFHDFRANYRRYEQWQFRRRAKITAAQAHDHNKLLYRQLRNRDVSPPDHFTLFDRLFVAVVLGDDLVELDDDITLPSDAGWMLQGQLVTLTPVTSNQVRIHTDLVLAAGQALHGSYIISDFERMEQGMAKMWTPIWMKHASVGPDRWQRAIAFAQNHLPDAAPSVVEWSPQKISSLAHKYKKHTATGPDGWSRLDIASLPCSALQFLSDMFEQVQNGAAWPQQLVTGFVCPARKHADAEAPKDFRPLILLSFLYRLWAMASSRATLATLASFASTHTYGFVPSKRTSDLWFLLQAAIEASGGGDDPIAGYNLDLVRCFNCLPRQPLFFVVGRLGMGEGTLCGWKQALIQLERRFQIGNNIGPPHRSTTGYPEGDPLSCTAMLSFCILMEHYLDFFSGSCILCSYVDNIQVLASNVGDLTHGYLTLKVFLNLMDLMEDPHKSYSWGSSPTLRQQLRAMGWQVRLAYKDLGAQMAFSKVSRTTVAGERAELIAGLWPILRASRAPKWFKQVAIRTALWPKVFHAVENRFCSFTFCKSLRTKVMQCLNWSRAGASPWVRVGLMCTPDLDPSFYQLWAVLRMALRMFQLFPWLCERWATFVQAPTGGQGPFHSLLQALDWLHWDWRPDMSLVADFISIPFEQLHVGLLRYLLELAWEDYVCVQVRGRGDYADLFTVDRKLSFAPITDDFGSAELLATIQDGTFFTGYALAKMDHSCTGFCSLCNVEDDLEHRCLHCPRYQQIRSLHQPCISRWHRFGPSFNLHGLVPRNELLLNWLSYLQGLPTCDDFAFLPDQFETYDLFTDGSCVHDEGFSYAAWAVVVPDQKRIVTQGLLQGIHQSNNRAELTAVLKALRWKLTSPCRVRIWTDSLYVITNVAYLRRHQTVPEHWSHRDLWLAMLLVVQVLDWSTASLHKVAAHCDPLSAQSPFDDWIIAGNDCADRAAKACNHARDDGFSVLFAALVTRQRQLRLLSTSRRNFLLDISRFDLQHEQRPLQHDPEEDLLCDLGEVAEENDCFVASCLASSPSSTELSRFEPQFLGDLAEWLSSIDILGAVKTPVSLAELVLGFVHCTKRTFPIVMPGSDFPNVVYPADSALGVLMKPTLSASAHILKDAITHLFSLRGAELPIVKQSRAAVKILCPVPCLVIGWPSEVALLVSRVFSEYAAHPIRHPRDLARHYPHPN